MSPRITPVKSSGVVLNGIVVAEMPASDLNSSPERCWLLPGLIEPKFSLPGLALAAAITSLMDLYGEPALVTTTML